MQYSMLITSLWLNYMALNLSFHLSLSALQVVTGKEAQLMVAWCKPCSPTSSCQFSGLNSSRVRLLHHAIHSLPSLYMCKCAITIHCGMSFWFQKLWFELIQDTWELSASELDKDFSVWRPSHACFPPTNPNPNLCMICPPNNHISISQPS